jgi:hypothetical protein
MQRIKAVAQWVHNEVNDNHTKAAANDVVYCCNELAGEQDTSNNILLLDTAKSLRWAISQLLEYLPDNLHKYYSDQMFIATKLDILELDPDTALEVYNILFDGFGIESVTDNNLWDSYYLDTAVLYVNQGDAYTETLILDVEAGKLLYTTLGDFLEQKQREIESSYYLFCDSHNGVYSWQMSAQQILADHKAKICKANKEALPTLRKLAKAKDLNRDSYHWNIEAVEMFEWLFEDANGQRWYLQQSEDIWAVKEYYSLPGSFN